jgi:anti-anti-sigma factor
MAWPAHVVAHGGFECPTKRESLAMNVMDKSADGLVVIGIEGELDRSNVALLEECLSAHLTAGKRHVVIDLETCSFIDSSGLAAILALHRDVRDEGLLAVVGPNKNVGRLLDLVGLLGDRGVEVYADVTTACAAISLN